SRRKPEVLYNSEAGHPATVLGFVRNAAMSGCRAQHRAEPTSTTSPSHDTTTPTGHQALTAAVPVAATPCLMRGARFSTHLLDARDHGHHQNADDDADRCFGKHPQQRTGDTLRQQTFERVTHGRNP